MTWFKLDDKGTFHRKVVAAGNEAYGAWCRAGQYAAAQHSDGFLPRSVADLIANQPVWNRLLKAGLLENGPDGGYKIHDFLDYNPSAADLAERASRFKKQCSLAGKASAAQRKTNSAGNSAVDSTVEPARNSAVEARLNQQDIQDSQLPSRPVPIPEEKENPPPWAGGPGGASPAPVTAAAEASSSVAASPPLPGIGLPGVMTHDIALEQSHAKDASEGDPWGLTPVEPKDAVKGKPGVKKVGCRLSPDWEPSSATVERFKHRERVDALGSLERFKNFWLSKSGAQAVKIDWDRTFVNWVLEDIARGRSTPWAPPPTPRPSAPEPDPASYVPMPPDVAEALEAMFTARAYENLHGKGLQ